MTTDTCPECGQQLRLRVFLVTPNLGAYVLGLIALAMSLGVTGLGTAYIATNLVFVAGTSLRGRMVTFFVFLIIASIVSLVLLVLWVKASHWLRRQRTSFRWALAACCLVAPVVDFVMLMVYGP